VTEFCGLKKLPLRNQLKPIWNEVVNRALPLAIGITAGQTPIGLIFYLALGKLVINLDVLCFSVSDITFIRIITANVDELKVVTCTTAHYSASN
jgi:hypothetical protein